MTLGKNFRLPLDIRPRSYAADLRLDLTTDRFDGELVIELDLAAPRREIYVHGVELEITSVSAGGGTGADESRARTGTATVDVESETVTLSFSDDLPRGPASVRVAYRGAFSPGLRGLYRAGSVAVTQFEAADARRLFPCFDEPAFKAKWRLTVSGVPVGAAAISNGVIERDESDGRGGRRISFTATPPLSSYLIALVVGPIVAMR